ncbi:MAG: signal transduction histidine kinase, partial [Haloquadratum sp. J07HQX50]
KIVSHDLRSPLNVAEGYLELEVASDARNRESQHLVKAKHAIERSQTLIEDLLTLAQAGEQLDELESMRLVEVAKGCWRTVETAAATLTVDATHPNSQTQTPAIKIEADRSRLKQLLENLYRNAVEHGGDDLTVSVGICEDGFYVADTGRGIPESERKDIFEVGYSTDEVGTGFGLRIVKQVADAHGWDIDVTGSEQGGRGSNSVAFDL